MGKMKEQYIEQQNERLELAFAIVDDLIKEFKVEQPFMSSWFKRATNLLTSTMPDEGKSEILNFVLDMQRALGVEIFKKLAMWDSNDE